MTHRERINAILERQPVDSIPWVPRLDLWYNGCRTSGTVPERYDGWSLREIQKDLGVGVSARNATLLKTLQKGVEINRYTDGMETLTEYITPVGKVSTRARTTQELAHVGIGGRNMEYRIKGLEDYGVIEYMIENTVIEPHYEAYFAYDEQIGDDGFPMSGVGDCPMGRIMREYIGYGNFYYELNDHTAQVENLYRIMVENDKEKLWPVVAKSPAKLILHGSFDSQFTSPPFFRKYYTPYYREFSKLLHDNGKYLACHADADTSLILTEIMDAGFDMAECFATSPMVDCTLKQAMQTWKNKVIIWGGIPSIMVCEPITDEYFEEYMMDLFETIAPGDRFILGVADFVMPDAKIERLRRVTEMVKEYGYPTKV